MQAEIWHYGIKGQKHGLRRFQNEDGSLTPEGRDRYGIGEYEKPRHSPGTISEGREEHRHPIGTKSGPVNSRIDPNKSIRDAGKQVKDLLKKHNESDDEKAQRDKSLDTLKKNYWGLMGQAIKNGVYGQALGSISKMLYMGGRHKVAATITGILGTALKFDAGFKAVAGTGAYFIGRNSVMNGKIKVSDIDEDKKDS